MKKFDYVITDEVGIHARPAGLLVNEAKKYGSSLTIECRGKAADLRKLMMIMSLGIKKGDFVTVRADGEDEDEAIANIEKIFRESL